MKNYPLYPHQQLDSIKELVLWCAEQYGDSIAFMYENKGAAQTVTYSAFKQQVFSLGSYLDSNGYQDCHIAVIGENSYEWIQTYFAVVCGKNVIVPLDKELSADEVAAKLADSDCKLLVLPKDYTDIIQSVQKTDVDIITMDQLAEMTEEGLKLIEAGHHLYVDKKVVSSDLASIVYTSGTTGASKGVMLTHGNFMSDTYGAASNVYLEGTGLLMLPLHHTFGLVASLFAGLYYGNKIYINKSIRRIAGDLKTAAPSYMFTVPLLVEQLHRKIWDQARKQKKDKILRCLMFVSDCLLKVHIDFRRVFFKSVLDSLGGNLSLVVSGGAPIDEKYIQDFCSLGINTLNGYGITECSPVVAVNRNKCAVKGSVGFPLVCNEVRIADDGEILVQGQNVMLGYYKMEEETQACLVDGWFHTGDIGHIDENGALHITGRKKNLIILSNGENVSAEELEELVKSTIPYVQEVVAFECGGKIAIEVYLDSEMPQKHSNIEKDIANLNHRLPMAKHISKIVTRDQEFPKTTTKKIIRNAK